jgi:hypothetical protein
VEEILMEAVDAIYEAGCAAGRTGAKADQNPYPKPEKVEGVYMLSNHDRWEMGRRRWVRCCPHCDGTGVQVKED